MDLQIIATEASLQPSLAVFDLETNAINKPKQALYSSSFNNEVFFSDWISWCIDYLYVSSNFRSGTDSSYFYIYGFTPKPSARVLTIDSISQIHLIPTMVRNESSPLPDSFPKQYFDYKALHQAGYDGLHITKPLLSAVRALYFTHFDLSKDFLVFSLSLWDVESTAWFNLNWYSDFWLLAKIPFSDILFLGKDAFNFSDSLKGIQSRLSKP